MKNKGFKNLITFWSNIEVSVFENITLTNANIVRDAIKSSKFEHYKQLRITDAVAKMRIYYHS